MENLEIEKPKEKKQNAKEIYIPFCITATYYFWEPQDTSSKRRANEKRVIRQASSFYSIIGFDVYPIEGGIQAEGEFQGERITAEFTYSESANYIYKHSKIYRDGKRSNISIIKKILNEINTKRTELI